MSQQRKQSLGLTALIAALLALCLFSAPALASRALIETEALTTKADPKQPEPPPEGQIEDACGAAFSPGGQLYVSDYYHRAIDVFAGAGYTSQLKEVTIAPEGPCQLAFSSSGALYVNVWHQGVQRLLPSRQTFDTANSTGVAVDASGRVYVNDRTYVAVYEASGQARKDAGGEVVKIGLGELEDAYGLAVYAGKVYVPDASTGAVEVYEASEPFQRLAEIAPPDGFHSLTDASLALDPTNAHLLVLDNLQPGYEHPQAAIDEFDASGAFLGELGARVIDAGPSGIVVDASGGLYVTSGNSEGANVFTFSPYTEAGSESFSGPGGGPGGAPGSAALLGPGTPGAEEEKEAPDEVVDTASSSAVVQHDKVRVAFDGELTPHKLPRSGVAPVRVAVGAKISPTGSADPPQLRKISIAINRHGHLDPTGLPVCNLDDIQPSTTQAALAACRSSLIGEGSFSAKVLLGQQAPFPSHGKIYAFNGRYEGKPAIFAHVYGTNPVPTSLTLPFVVQASKGTYGTVLSTALPKVTGNSAYITGLSITLGRRYRYQGRQRSYVSAGCPAPKGFSSASFPFARALFAFKGARSLSSTLVRSCGVRG